MRRLVERFYGDFGNRVHLDYTDEIQILVTQDEKPAVQAF